MPTEAHVPASSQGCAPRRIEVITLCLILLAGLALRLILISSPLGELDADEAVTGLMARHIAFLGERPVFYWGQAYLGTLEEFSAAAAFAIFGSSTFALKLIPSLYSLLFVMLSWLCARRLFGPGVGVATAAYLALPPAMLALWSIKARGGYAELLVLGEALVLTTMWLSQSRSPALGLAWGCLGGLALWTHLLAVVYIVPCVVYLLIVSPRTRTPRVALSIIAGWLAGAAPVLVYNIANDWATFAEQLQPSDLPFEPLHEIPRFFRVAVPVLFGVGAPVAPSDRSFSDPSYLAATAGPVWAAGLTCAALVAAVLSCAPALRACLMRRPSRASHPALLLGVAAVVVAAITLTSFGYYATEPRYALPVYTFVPVLIALAWRLPLAGKVAAAIGVAVLHARSLLLTSALLYAGALVGSTVETRSLLIRALEEHHIDHIHTDYWTAQPVMFESDERILADVVDGGPNRNLDLAIPVSADPAAAWVFEADSAGEQRFLDAVLAERGSPRMDSVSIYRVYTDVSIAVLSHYDRPSPDSGGGSAIP